MDKKNKIASIQNRLKNISKEENVDFDFVLLRYFQERLLYRLSISSFADNFVLKGGLLLTCLSFPVSRPTKDIDLLAENLKNEIETIKEIFIRVSNIEYDDGVKFISSSIRLERITEDANYEGVRVKIIGTLGKIRKTVQIDIGFGDILVFDANIVEFPSLLEEPTKLKAYPIESFVSEKFEAMIKLSIFNSRMKDFYDIYRLSYLYNFDGVKLKKAIQETFLRRQTEIPTKAPLIFKEEFYYDKEKQKMWESFIQKNNLSDLDKEFNVVMERIISFLNPIILSINKNTKMKENWDPDKGKWI